MKSTLLLFISFISFNVFGDSQIAITRTYDDPTLGYTEVYEFSGSNLKLNKNYFLNKASLGEYIFPFDSSAVPQYSHSKTLKTELCLFDEYDTSLDEKPGKVALQADSKFSLSTMPYITKQFANGKDGITVAYLHFILKANYWGNSAGVRGRRIHVKCNLSHRQLSLENMERFVDGLISRSFRTKK